ncbi:uncharacterized protein LOC135392584 [Ornithodoros turicata]|uniref:uncharacterized protein LOC135392584 n=1 Tax=Ornithodoros turicata TaxID=34597 RepID=UPI003139A3D7
MDRLLGSKRSARRAQNTKLVNEVDALLKQSDVTETAFIAFRDRLTASNDPLKQLNVQIEPHLANDELEAEFTTVNDYEDQCVKVLSEIRSRLASLQASTGEPSTQGPTTQRETPYNGGVKLPKLQMMQFKGELAQFWEQFEAAIHQNEGLSPVEKFQYFRSLLIGPMMTDILLAALPPDIVVEYHRGASNDPHGSELREDDSATIVSQSSAETTSEASESSKEMSGLLNFFAHGR